MPENNKSAARAGASVARTAPSVDSLVVGNSAPALGTCSSADSAALGEGGAGSHLSGGPSPRRFLPLLLLLTTSTPRSPGERAPAAHVAGIPRPAAPGALAAGFFVPSCVPLLLLPPLRRARARGFGAWAGRSAQRSRPLSAKKSEMSELQRCITKE
jgi:hypothetical protein